MRMRITREAVLASAVGAFQDWRLSIACGGCGDAEDMPLANQIVWHGAHYRFSELLEMVTCRKCGRKPILVDLVNPSPPLQRVALADLIHQIS
jgi:hypothetical protein